MTPITSRYMPKGFRSSSVSTAEAAHAPAAAVSRPHGTACRRASLSSRPLFR